MLLAVNFPSWLKPEIFPNLPLRWYSLMYIVAFSIAYILYRKQVKERNFPMSDDDMINLFFWGIMGLILGARIFYTVVYAGSIEYLLKPWLIFWPFQNGQFVGIQGMSYHGGVIGCILGCLIYTIVKKFDFREIGDMVTTAIPLGYTFGRLGNFINGELYGRVTTNPIGMIFPFARPFSARLEWVREIAEKVGIPISDPNAMINLPRHPSQLYEALFEGIVLFAILWLLRNHKPVKGFLFGMYMIGYGFFRFVIEYFREPDLELGYRIELAPSNIPPALFSSVLNFSTGQILCFLMITGGLIWIFVMSRLPDPKPIIIYPLENKSDESSTGKTKKESTNKKKGKKYT
jgi:phosphatidylglycerol:prolipoprotein diacylglycerol transferase